MANAIFLSKDQSWATESTTYWFELSGTDYGTNLDFDGDVFGIVESCGEYSVVDCDGCPVTPGDGIDIAIRNTASVTDDMRSA
jgi:hypothetical protein